MQHETAFHFYRAALKKRLFAHILRTLQPKLDEHLGGVHTIDGAAQIDPHCAIFIMHADRDHRLFEARIAHAWQGEKTAAGKIYRIGHGLAA